MERQSERHVRELEPRRRLRRVQSVVSQMSPARGSVPLELRMWHYREWGTGPPLVLLHGIGMSHATWRAVIPFLSRTRRVIAFDIAGFGETPALPSGVAPTVQHLAESLAETLDDLSLR